MVIGAHKSETDQHVLDVSVLTMLRKGYIIFHKRGKVISMSLHVLDYFCSQIHVPIIATIELIRQRPDYQR
jgi:hypothetical protein